MPTSSTHTLLWDRGWCTKSLINALGTQQGTECWWTHLGAPRWYLQTRVGEGTRPGRPTG